MNKKILILLASLVALLCSCGDDVLSNSDGLESKKAKTRLYVTVLNHSNGQPVVGAKLNLQSAGKIVETPESGVVVFEDVNIGRHLLLIEAADYASSIVTPDVDAITVIGETGKASQKTYYLYPKTASIEGYIEHTDSDGKTTGADKLPVRISFGDCDLVETITEPISTNKGKFKFENLPAVGDDCEVSIETTGGTVGGKTYGAMVIGYGYDLKEGSKINTGTLPISDAHGIFTVATYVKEIEYGKEATPIVYTFSKNIASSQKITDVIRIYPADLAYNIEISGKKVTITPLTRWDEGSFVVDFIDLKSETGDYYSGSYYPAVLSKDISGSKVEGLSLAPGRYKTIWYSDNRALITFKKLDGATGYKFYLEEDGKVSDITGSCTLQSGADSAYYCPISLETENAVGTARIGDNETKITVRAYNAQFESKDAELNISETEPVAPVLATTSQICVPSLENGKVLAPCPNRLSSPYSQNVRSLLSSYAAEAMVALGENKAASPGYYGYYGDIYFSRAMNTEKKIDLKNVCSKETGVTNNPCSRLDLGYEWINDQTFRLKVKIKSGTALDPGAVNANITLEDIFVGKNGKSYDSTLVVKIQGEVPDPCDIDPFVNGCTNARKEAFCNIYNNFRTHREDCEDKYPDWCNELPGLTGTPACPGGYVVDEDFEGSTSGWFIFGDGSNQWVIRTATAYTGSRSAYISNDNNSWSYDKRDVSTSYLYKEVSFLSSASYNFSFAWYVGGEEDYDYMLVCLVTNSDDLQNNCYKGGTADIAQREYSNSTWALESFNKYIPEGNYYLVFKWVNDGSIGGNSAAIDNIKVQLAP